MKPIDILKQQQEFRDKIRDLFWKINKAFLLDAEKFFTVDFETEEYYAPNISNGVYFHYMNDENNNREIGFTEEEFNDMMSDFKNSIIQVELNKKEAQRKYDEERMRKAKEEERIRELKYQEKFNELAKSYGVTNPIEYEKALRQLKNKHGKY